MSVRLNPFDAFAMVISVVAMVGLLIGLSTVGFPGDNFMVQAVFAYASIPFIFLIARFLLYRIWDFGEKKEVSG